MTSDELVGRTWKVVHMSRPLISCSEATSLDTVSSEGISSAENNESKIIRLVLLIICCPKTKTLVFTNSLMADVSFITNGTEHIISPNLALQCVCRFDHVL